ncbi:MULTISPECIES: phage antirepressor KilAC domain-containing protein [Hungatella]|uniref:phage antirepressor KilAC domain-containing protein n=1 Tax=Hungatella TaxID=1649459 RepID=UPI0026728825|nr:phage antirepressor KilAC domain-containing protein [Hungatella hathewayi]
MEELMKISYESGQPTVSARELHEGLDIKTPYTMWFERMAEYGFTDGKDFFTKMLESTGGRPSVDHAMTVDMAKQICMIQRTEQGRTYRQYLLDLEKAWNTPEQVFARALKMADQTINRLQSDITRMRPKEIFADAVTASHTSILVGDMAKLLKQNGVDMGAQRLFTWLRDNGYLIRRKGADWNMPTQRSMEMGLFEIKESSHLNGNGCNVTTRTPKVTGKGQQYFINKFLGGERSA